MDASEHTRLVNKVIGLCKNDIKWPNVLHDLGYDVQLIEKTIPLQRSPPETITPDVVAVSNRLLHALVIDCKSGTNIKSDQDRRYESLECDDLTHHVSVHDSNQLTHVVCYVDGESNHESLESHTRLPFITFGLEEVRGRRDFGRQEVNDELHEGVSLNGMDEPTGYYPFSPDDEGPTVIQHVLPGLLVYLVQRGRGSRPTTIDADMAEAILKYIHPFHEEMSTRHRRALTNMIKHVIELCKNHNDEFKQQLAKIEGGMTAPKTMQSMQRICYELVDRVDEYARQKTLDNP